jgi:hypothetical protein
MAPLIAGVRAAQKAAQKLIQAGEQQARPQYRQIGRSSFAVDVANGDLPTMS